MLAHSNYLAAHETIGYCTTIPHLCQLKCQHPVTLCQTASARGEIGLLG
jgi:hypothetical protein